MLKWVPAASVIPILLLVAATRASAIGLPKGWEKPIALIEYPRPAGITCGGKQTTDDPAEKDKPQEKEQPEYCSGATGFVVVICGQTLLFSNRHVFGEAQKEKIPLFIRWRHSSGDPVRLPVGRTWKAHPDPKIDIAASLVVRPADLKQEELEAQFFPEDHDRTSETPSSFFLKQNQLRPGDDILMVGFPGSIPGVQEILEASDQPLFRAGVVSMILPGETTIDGKPFKDVLLVDSWAFQGNSGSPVFLLPSFFKYQGDDRPEVKRNRPYIIGIVSDFLNWQAEISLAQHSVQPIARPVANTNAGLAIVQAADGIETVAREFPGAVCPAT